jgi:hypothetical protein
VLKTATDNLIYAIAKGDQTAAEIAIASGADLNGLSSDDAFQGPMTPLMTAVVAQSSNLEKWLVSKGADPSPKENAAVAIAIVGNSGSALFLLQNQPSLPPDSPLLGLVVTRPSYDVSINIREVLLSGMLGKPLPGDEAPDRLLDLLERPSFCSDPNDPFIALAGKLITLG